MKTEICQTASHFMPTLKQIARFERGKPRMNPSCAEVVLWCRRGNQGKLVKWERANQAQIFLWSENVVPAAHMPDWWGAHHTLLGPAF